VVEQVGQLQAGEAETTAVAATRMPTRALAHAAVAAVAAAMFYLLYRDVGAYFVGRWVAEKEYQHCFLVLPLVGWLVWRQRQKLVAEAKPGSWAGLAAVAGAVLIYLLGLRVGANVIVGFSFPLLLFALGWACLGWPAFRHIAGPSLLTAFLIPVPRHMIGIVAMPMQVISAHATAVLSSLIGVATSANGVTLTTPSTRFLVAQECSGFNSLLALLLIGCTVVQVLRMRLDLKLVLLLLIPPIVVLANIVRLLAVVLASEFFGAKFALDALIHGFTDIIVYLAALTCLILLADFLSSRGRTGELAAEPSG